VYELFISLLHLFRHCPLASTGLQTFLSNAFSNFFFNLHVHVCTFQVLKQLTNNSRKLI
jgi:hypothetical protein